ncbi:MAG TPA: hypothetical protein VHR66_18275 [Gemmataceae bacterium]|jgi:hypothetical protein|nr:hypothetical protein [Gemmataceae bacterium]
MTRPRTRRLALHVLESRLNPAVTIVNPLTATLTDIDGDLVTVKVSSGVLTAGLFTTQATGLGDQLQTINFSGGGFDGAALTVSVKKVPTGDGLVNVGYINSANHDLGVVSVAGDLGRIDAGDATTSTTAITSLSVRSMGRYGVDTQLAGSPQSNVNGPLGKLNVTGDIIGSYINVTGGADGTIGSVTIGGSLIGGTSASAGNISTTGDIGLIKIGHNIEGGPAVAAGQIHAMGRIAGVTIGGSIHGASGADSGELRSDNDMGPVKIGHDVVGGDGPVSGTITTTGKLASVTFGGSLVGGTFVEAGEIRSVKDMGPVKIGFDVIGGVGNASGRISTDGTLASVSIGGSMIGGVGGNSGEIISAKDMGAVKIGHNMVGASIDGVDADVDASGYIESGGRIATVTFGGSIITGIDNSTVGSLTKNGSVRAANDIGSITVTGSVIGNVGPNGASTAIISARGQSVQGPTTDVAIGKIKIGGRVEHSLILAGYNLALTGVNADAQIGPVTIGGDWIASSLAAGVVDGGNGFGNMNDSAIAGGSAGIVSKITSVAIKGLVYGTPAAAGADHFGFVAQQIGAFKCLGFTATLTAATDAPQELALTTGDVTVREVP